MAPPAKTTPSARPPAGRAGVARRVLRAAKQRFAAEGYEKTTLRAIANDARVDPSMVLYLFGSKAELFRESLRLIVDPDVLVAALGPTATATSAPAWCAPYLRIWETPDTAASMRRDAAVGHVEPRRARSVPRVHAELRADRGVRRARRRRAGPAAGDARRDAVWSGPRSCATSCGCRRWRTCPPTMSSG